MMLYARYPNGDRRDPSEAPVSHRCPACRKRAVFSAFLNDYDLTIDDRQETGTREIRLGKRHCPDPDCGAVIFFAAHEGRKEMLVSYPGETIDFDSTDLPDDVQEALEEAIKCHSLQCYTAAAIMVRKTLEELCRERGAVGDNLQQRVAALGQKVVLPQELLDGLDDLRLLGNDAAHVEARVYNEVGQEEVEVGIDVAKEVLKAVYQYRSLLGRLRSLKQGHESS